MAAQREPLPAVLPAVLLLIVSGCAAGADPIAWRDIVAVDLTHPFAADTVVWPTEHDFRLVRQQAGDTAGGYYYASNRIEMPEHGGTHIDAPIHFSKGAPTLDQVPLDRLMGPAVHIDVSGPCAADRDYRVTVDDLERWEAAHGRIPNGTIVLLETGFARFWPDRKAYLGTERRGREGVAELHFPGLHEEAAHWLVRERRVKAVGIDTASIDYGQSTGFEAHVVLLSHHVPVFENLADLRRLPASGFDVVALPMRIAGGTGGPLRMVALLPAR
ncbi:cyclase family protein [Nitrospira moscoviensis]|uniref:cyclase family protein n=1 Tax=Nitrospira moscoviensis TaxID=42253 RepID=UPI0006A77F84|nr:cyclase family protein [Nitrospira moscoviensis]